MSLAEQLGNVGSEYSRARRCKKNGNEQFFEKAFARLLELLDLTITDNRWRGARRRELARVRSEVCTEFMQADLPGNGFSKYFDSMAIAARH
ncbi:MAG: hypothetical protein WCT08_01370 [Patescibacteria group bacterium]|jgi:hypothetical protein